MTSKPSSCDLKVADGLAKLGTSLDQLMNVTELSPFFLVYIVDIFVLLIYLFAPA